MNAESPFYYNGVIGASDDVAVANKGDSRCGTKFVWLILDATRLGRDLLPATLKLCNFFRDQIPFYFGFFVTFFHGKTSYIVLPNVAQDVSNA